MSTAEKLAVAGLFISAITVMFVVIDRIKKKNPDLIDRAMKMVELADEQADELRAQLLKANETINNLNHQLTEANNQVTSLNRELHDARDKIIYLEQQVKIMTNRVERDNGRKD